MSPTSSRVTVKALRPTEALRATLRDFARERDVDFVAVETLAGGPQVVLVKTACGVERLEGDVTREQVEAAIAKCDVAKGTPASAEHPKAAAPATPEPPKAAGETSGAAPAAPDPADETASAAESDARPGPESENP